MSKQSSFNLQWLADPSFSQWVAKHPTNSHKAKCVPCGKNIELGNMGRKALSSHAAGDKLKARLKSLLKGKQEQQSLKMFWNSDACVAASSADAISRCENQEEKIASLADQLTIPEPPQGKPPGQLSEAKDRQNNLASFMSKDSVLEAEIVWAVKTVMDHYSCSSSSNTEKLFQRMFPDSEIAKKLSCGKTKCAYLVKYGLAPYFYEKMLSVLPKPETLFSVSFDESFNKVIQEEQMDLLVRYWDDEVKEVVTRYFGSEFLGHTRAGDLRDKFLKGLSPLNQANMVQVSMDGPSTNWKFYEELVKLRNGQDPDIPLLLNLGFKTGAQKIGWNIDSLLRSLYNLFHDAPARAEDFVNITGSTQFPRKFCSTRWLEDAPVAERAIMIWPNIVKYVNETLKGPKGKVPKIQSFNTVQASTQDPFITAKLQFFVTQANMLQPYLQKHQTDDPMAVFMAQDLAYIVRSAMSKFVKKDVIDTASSSAKLVNIELEKEDNFLPPKDVDVGFAVKAITEKLQKDRKVSQLQIRSFFSECRTFLIAATAKILERCPLKYQLLRSLSALDPRHMALQPDDATRKFERLLAKLLAKLLVCRQFKADECDGAKRQFDVLLAEVQKYHKEEFEAYTTCQRLDKFFFKVLAEKPHYNVLWKVVKLVLVLLHGQAGIERGFSENKDILSCNMGEDTVKAFRTVYDGVKHMKCEVHDIPVSKELLKSCKQS